MPDGIELVKYMMYAYLVALVGLLIAIIKTQKTYLKGLRSSYYDAPEEPLAPTDMPHTEEEPK